MTSNRKSEDGRPTGLGPGSSERVRAPGERAIRSGQIYPAHRVRRIATSGGLTKLPAQASCFSDSAPLSFQKERDPLSLSTALPRRPNQWVAARK
jgi:hypothetical protein